MILLIQINRKLAFSYFDENIRKTNKINPYFTTG